MTHQPNVLNWRHRLWRMMFACLSDSDVERLTTKADIVFENGKHVPMFNEIARTPARMSILAGEFSMSCGLFTLTFWAHTRVSAVEFLGVVSPIVRIKEHSIGTVKHANGSEWKIIISPTILSRLEYWLKQ